MLRFTVRAVYTVYIIHKTYSFTQAQSTKHGARVRDRKAQRVCVCLYICAMCSLVRRAQLIAHTISFFNHVELMSELIRAIISSLSHGMRIYIPRHQQHTYQT